MNKLILVSTLIVISATGVMARPAEYTGNHKRIQHGLQCEYKSHNGKLSYFVFRNSNCSPTMEIT